MLTDRTAILLRGPLSGPAVISVTVLIILTLVHIRLNMARRQLRRGALFIPVQPVVVLVGKQLGRLPTRLRKPGRISPVRITKNRSLPALGLVPVTDRVLCRPRRLGANLLPKPEF